MKLKPIDLNAVETVLLGEELQAIREGLKAQDRIARIVGAIVHRLGVVGTYRISEDVQQLIPVENGKEPTNGNQQ